MELNLTQVWMVHKKQHIAHLFFFISKAFGSPSDHLSAHRNVCSQAKSVSETSDTSQLIPQSTQERVVSQPRHECDLAEGWLTRFSPFRTSFLLLWAPHARLQRGPREITGKQWSWNLILFDSGNTMSRMSLIPLVLLRQSCKRKTGGFFNLLQSISLHVSGFYFWCLNWKGITPPSLWNNLSPSLEADSTVLIFISLFVFFMTCFTKTLADLFELRSSLPTEEA